MNHGLLKHIVCCEEKPKITELAEHFINVHPTFGICPHCGSQIPKDETPLNSILKCAHQSGTKWYKVDQNHSEWSQGV